MIQIILHNTLQKLLQIKYKNNPDYDLIYITPYKEYINSLLGIILFFIIKLHLIYLKPMFL